MTKTTRQDPLHGITLETLLTRLVEQYGWEELAHRIHIKCFSSNPSMVSSLKFLRKTPWARQKVEALYLQNYNQTDNNAALNPNNPTGL